MNEKQLAGERASDYIKDGMVVGLGTGSTAYYMLKALAQRVQEGLSIKGVATSQATTDLANKWGIPLVSIDDVSHIDVTIDGADEVDDHLNGIKGGGGALLYEKVVAKASKEVIWIVDAKKKVKTLGAFPLPIEVLPFGASHSIALFEQKGLQPQLRRSDEEIFITDSGHYIVDIQLPQDENVEAFAAWLDTLTGVIEHGLFLNMAHTLIVGEGDQVRIYKK
ncbi:ribose 5-phosphate isomerase [Fictibacillus macauensis ZFHKF-1]|uniref:Ribose-5-phosphate isomerase A n=1 Tax=Fictibacillus macauensis ZFHKF-1 TaxID=1196324 RepID=I8UHS6_9BACL|nr:ribose-5-phosphate isomerase RpiA [Fictibacillus macauensis]EIT86383.1 ribose 5-phosphate isomerase [Fictibacillus macauensis ZFHKF-1]